MIGNNSSDLGKKAEFNAKSSKVENKLHGTKDLIRRT